MKATCPAAIAAALAQEISLESPVFQVIRKIGCGGGPLLSARADDRAPVLRAVRGAAP